MNDKIMELFGIVLKIQSEGVGQEGYPYINFTSSNYGSFVEIQIKDNGFGCSSGYDGVYIFDKNYFSERTYQNCKEHLEELVRKAKKCTAE